MLAHMARKAQGCREQTGGCCGCITLVGAVCAAFYCYQQPDWTAITATVLGTLAALIVCGWIIGAKQPGGPFKAWRTLRGPDFEHFLAASFRNLGYAVDCVGQSGDQGIDIIVTVGQVRIGVQAKGYGGVVGNAAVQEAFTGMHFHRCQRCAVVTNSTFTRAAVALAATLPNCTLVDGSRLEALITGWLAI